MLTWLADIWSDADAKIATIEFDELAAAAAPFFFCCLAATLWVLLCFLCCARLLPDFWIKRGVTEVALSLGATATALLVVSQCNPSSHPANTTNSVFLSLCRCNNADRLAHACHTRSQLRMMDPDNRTPVLRAFCYKQLVNVLLVGGGVFTSSSLTISHTAGAWGLFAVSAGGAVFWFAVLLALRARAATSTSSTREGLGAPLLSGAT